MIAPLIALSQKSDSLKNISIPKWKLERLLQSHFYILPSCDSTVIAYQKALELADSTINSANKVILIRTQQRDLKVLEAYTCEQRFSNQKTIHQQELKQATKKGRKQGIILTGIPAILLIILLL